MARRQRTFETTHAVRTAVPLLIGITGGSSSGKTYSMLRLLMGIQRVVGGKVGVIDTEHRRCLHYADEFDFEHMDLKPPHGPLDYDEAIAYMVSIGVTTLGVDTMTHEHSGDGGVMDQSEKWLDKQCGDDYKKRKRLFMASLVEPKKQRKQLNRHILHLGINAVLCYRAAEKIKPVKGDEPERLGWQPDTTSTLHYDMTARFLLEPGSDGKPTLDPENPRERLLVKSPSQFRGWWKPGMQLSEDVGETMARWAAGETPKETSAATSDAFRFSSGKHAGKLITEVPRDYLVALVDHEKTPDAVRERAQRELDDRDMPV